MLIVLVFLVVLFALIIGMHRAVVRDANKKLRDQFDAQGVGGEGSRELMRRSGYRI